MKDELGNRMKEQYENRYRYYLPRRTYTICRLDGKSFHNYTRKFARPFDHTLIECMNSAAIAACKEASGAQFAYVQSDEISILLTDFTTEKTESWFNGNIQKIVSVSSSIVTAEFNLQIQLAFGYLPDQTKKAHFDSRVFIIPDPIEVENYFIWRQQDWTRNSIQAVAQSLYSHKQLHKKNHEELQEMIFKKGINWNDYSIPEKRGRVIKKENKVSYTYTAGVTRDPNDTGKVWVVDKEIPVFTKDRNYLKKMIPRID
jgi:tRNA(His) guanylyltransferase